ncbi:K(+)-transporting ATPase subunit F [Fictibacillus nanhaiensis]|uniref:K(+)-transporting ATPase subunit F n=1 Tax=Fictibacillus nanhaiensis TaxID=742169 RepID=A0ABS2ZQE1_9BACL|nr:K(+)-transporting ATPase subunit F [Fictibacillus nanhaiensis]MQR97010.1 K(+)-transporting ATPase subunit F [Fictibacillus phosphorivorans]
MIITMVATGGVFLYLVYALINPEKF